MPKLIDICDKINMGQSPDSSSYNKEADGLPFFQGNADFGKVHPIARVWCNAPKKIAYPNDILISVRAPIGALNIADQECCIGRGLAAISVDNTVCDRMYLWYALQNKANELNSKGTGSTFKAITKVALYDTEVQLPSLEQQRFIACRLSNVQDSIDICKTIIEKLDLSVKSRFVEMFGDISTEHYKYETRKLGEVAEVGSSHRVFTTEFVDDGIPFYRGTEIGELANGKRPSNPYYISEEHYYRLANDETKPKVGDLLMPSICNKGQVWMVDTEEPFYYKDGRVLCISADRNVYDSKYLQYFMKAKTEVEYPKMGSGSTFAEFKIFVLKDFNILTPPKEIQREFSTFVRQVDKSKYAVESLLNKLTILRASLMQEYFG